MVTEMVREVLRRRGVSVKRLSGTQVYVHSLSFIACVYIIPSGPYVIRTYKTSSMTAIHTIHAVHLAERRIRLAEIALTQAVRLTTARRARTRHHRACRT